MSLFGDDDALPSRSRSSALFDDEPTPAAVKTSTSLFADDVGAGDDSPWGFPTPKKAARGNLVKTLLPPGDVPDTYIDAYDTLLASSGDKIGLDAVHKLLQDAGVSSEDKSRILRIVVPDGQEPAQGLGRGEFNVLFALVGLAQEGEDVTLDSVDERRRSKAAYSW